MKKLFILFLLCYSIFSNSLVATGQPISIGIQASNQKYDVDYDAYIVKATSLGYTKPSVVIQRAQNQFVRDLKTAGLWARMKTGYFLHSGSVEMGTINLKNPNTYQSTLVNSPSFSEGNGTKSNGTTSYINQPFKSQEYAGIQSDLTFVQYISESSTSASVIASHGFTVATATYMLLYPLQASAVLGRTYNFDGVSTTFSSTDHRGLYIHRNTGTTATIWKNGTKTTSALAAVTPTRSQNRLILAVNIDLGNNVTPTQWYTIYVAVDFLFDGFSDADELAFRTAFNTYKTSTSLP